MLERDATDPVVLGKSIIVEVVISSGRRCCCRLKGSIWRSRSDGVGGPSGATDVEVEDAEDVEAADGVDVEVEVDDDDGKSRR